MWSRTPPSQRATPQTTRRPTNGQLSSSASLLARSSLLLSSRRVRASWRTGGSSRTSQRFGTRRRFRFRISRTRCVVPRITRSTAAFSALAVVCAEVHASWCTGGSSRTSRAEWSGGTMAREARRRFRLRCSRTHYGVALRSQYGASQSRHRTYRELILWELILSRHRTYRELSMLRSGV